VRVSCGGWGAVRHSATGPEDDDEFGFPQHDPCSSRDQRREKIAPRSFQSFSCTAGAIAISLSCPHRSGRCSNPFAVPDRAVTLGVTSHVLRSLRFRLVLACLSCSSRRTESFDFHLKLRHSILNYSRKACVNAWCKKQLEESAGKIHKPENEKRGVSVQA